MGKNDTMGTTGTMKTKDTIGMGEMNSARQQAGSRRHGAQATGAQGTQGSPRRTRRRPAVVLALLFGLLAAAAAPAAAAQSEPAPHTAAAVRHTAPDTRTAPADTTRLAPHFQDTSLRGAAPARVTLAQEKKKVGFFKKLGIFLLVLILIVVAIVILVIWLIVRLIRRMLGRR
ncbi:hypothetical protein [Streptomyces celluloflavus]|uniref:hypothetical protein n=1 Tax=Streptomyces celluloflavus TaxID=58344 RepID=UPI003648FF67